ncbi:hypothetical protein KCP73_13915 [Salmonella enterica subsp. enterica]|nr:hypothetical protein KCP73_13915 [Salmonella enterica subsp. enterica]
MAFRTANDGRSVRPRLSDYRACTFGGQYECPATKSPVRAMPSTMSHAFEQRPDLLVSPALTN